MNPLGNTEVQCLTLDFQTVLHILYHALGRWTVSSRSFVYDTLILKCISYVVFVENVGKIISGS